MRRLPVLLLAACLVAACSGAGLSDGISLAEAHVARLTASDSDGKLAGEAVNAFGLALYSKASSSSGNLVISPASIAVALSMARAGARGATATEMDAVLHDLATDAHAGWVASLDQALNARTASFQDPMGNAQEVTLRVVNAPFAQRGMNLAPTYLDALSARFGAGVRLVDYKTAAEAARADINGWVSDQTEQRIKELLAKGTIDAATRLVLVNAIYLKAAWLHQFEKSATADAPFHAIGGSTVTVSMMAGGGTLPYAEEPGWQAVELPYVGGKLVMDVIVPADFKAFEGSFDAAKLDAITSALAGRQVTLDLPRFTAESALGLGDTLAAMGMPTAFTGNADFSGISTDEQLFISAVIHQANIDVDENGTTAAAATAVAIAASGAPGDPVKLTVDRPFLFVLRDLDTGAVLFLGRIVDPSAPKS